MPSFPTTWRGSPDECIQHVSSWWPGFDVGHTLRDAVRGSIALVGIHIALFLAPVFATAILSTLLFQNPSGFVDVLLFVAMTLFFMVVGGFSFKTPLSILYKTLSPRRLDHTLQRALRLTALSLCPYADPNTDAICTQRSETSIDLQLTLRAGARVHITLRQHDQKTHIQARITLPNSLPNAASWRPQNHPNLHNTTVLFTQHTEPNTSLLSLDTHASSLASLPNLLHDIQDLCHTYTDLSKEESDTHRALSPFARHTPPPQQPSPHLSARLDPARYTSPPQYTHAHTRALVVWSTLYNVSTYGTVALTLYLVFNNISHILHHERVSFGPSTSGITMLTISAVLTMLSILINLRRFNPKTLLHTPSSTPQHHPTLSLNEHTLSLDTTTVDLSKPFTPHLSYAPAPPNHLWLHITLRQDHNTLSFRTRIPHDTALTQTLPKLQHQSPSLPNTTFQHLWPTLSSYCDIHGIRLPWGSLQLDSTHTQHHQHTIHQGHTR